MTKNAIKNYFYQISQGIASAIVVTLGVGLLLQNIGSLTNFSILVVIGGVSKTLMIPALGAGIAYYMKVDILTFLSAIVAGVIGGQAYGITDEGYFMLTNGEPVGALIAIILTLAIGSFLFGKTRFDMIIVPFIAIIFGGGIGLLLSQPIGASLQRMSVLITDATKGYPFLAAVAIAILFTLLILSPASSAALALALNLEGAAAAAALIGCSIPFTVFAVLGWQDNDWGTFFGQLIITPKLQTGNLIRKPSLTLIPVIFSAILAPIGLLVFHLEATAQIAGLGFCALVAPLEIFRTDGIIVLLQYLFISLIIPGVTCLLIRPFLLKIGWLKPTDLAIYITPK